MSAVNFGQSWPSSWTTDATINGVSVAGGANSSNSGTIANSASSPGEVLDTEIGVTIAYGSTVSYGGAIVYLCGDVDGTHFESAASDQPFSFQLPAVASTTVRRRFVVYGNDISRFQVVVGNPSGNSAITATLTYHQSSGQQG